MVTVRLAFEFHQQQMILESKNRSITVKGFTQKFNSRLIVMKKNQLLKQFTGEPRRLNTF